MLIGYARISTQEQSLDLQTDALKKIGCEKIFSEIASGAKTDRKELENALNYLREGDTLVVWKLDRLGRSLQHLVKVINDLKDKNIGFMSVQENIDTSTPGGKLIFHVFAALSEFERDIIRERTTAGLMSARARGRVGGRKHLLSPDDIIMARKLHSDPSNNIDQICKLLGGISKPTLYRALNADSNKYKK